MFWQRSKHRDTSHIIYNSRSLSKLYKAKTNKKESGLINETKKQVSPSFKTHHSLSWSLYICSLRSCPLPIIPLSLSREEGMIHFFVGSHVKKPESGLFFWLDRKQYGWFALFQLAKMPPSVSCCWFQSAFLLASSAVNTHASSL